MVSVVQVSESLFKEKVFPSMVKFIITLHALYYQGHSYCVLVDFPNRFLVKLAAETPYQAGGGGGWDDCCKMQKSDCKGASAVSQDKK